MVVLVLAIILILYFKFIYRPSHDSLPPAVEASPVPPSPIDIASPSPTLVGSPSQKEITPFNKL